MIKLSWPGFRAVSLRLRLALMFLAVALLVWLVAGLMAWWESRQQLDEFFDSSQLLAHQPAAAGSGLGLSIIARVAEAHGLELKLRNVPPNSFSVILVKGGG